MADGIPTGHSSDREPEPVSRSTGDVAGADMGDGAKPDKTTDGDARVELQEGVPSP